MTGQVLPHPSPTPVVMAQISPDVAHLSVLAAARYRILEDGRLALLEAPAPLAAQWLAHPVPTRLAADPGATRKARPSGIAPALLRDHDLYAWRAHTDLIIQATARSRRPVKRLKVKLEVNLPQALKLEILASGDRTVTGAPGAYTLSDPEPFTELPLSFDRAFGGADPAGEHHLLSPEQRAELENRLQMRLPRPFGLCAYPRNPVGRGYVLDEERLLGMAWPNLLWAGARFAPQQSVRHPLDWDLCPLPACFDWISPFWFPRSAWMSGMPRTREGRLPASEQSLGAFQTDPRVKRPPGPHLFALAQGSSPLLWRGRWRGNERLILSHAGPEGGALVVQLPGQQPRMTLEQPGPPKGSPGFCTRRTDSLRPELDLVYVEADARRVTLLWRGTGAAGLANAPNGWERLCQGRVDF